MAHTPHDALFKFAFSKAEHAIGELRSVLPPALVVQIDWDSLDLRPGSLIDTALEQTHSDVVWSLQLGGRSAFLYVLLEHQSTVDALMPFRLLKYMVGLWDGWLAEHPDAKTLPVIVPIVVHHSDSGWTAATAFEQLFDMTESVRIALGERSAARLEAGMPSSGSRAISVRSWSCRSRTSREWS